MSKQKKSVKKAENQLIEEYNEIMSTSIFKMGIYQEWKEKGDVIEKFTIYENYTPVKTTSGTGVIK